MKRLMLLRHAEATPTGLGQRDIDRALTERGTGQSQQIGRHLAENKWVPNLALCSAAQRARQTWGSVKAEIAAEIPSEYDEALYLGAPARLYSAVVAVPPTCDTVILVTHNPAIGQFAHTLAARTASGLSHNLDIEYPPATLVVLDIEATSWSALETARMELVAVIRPAEL